MLSDWTKLFFSVLYKFVILRVFEEQIEVCTNYYGQYNEVVEDMEVAVIQRSNHTKYSSVISRILGLLNLIANSQFQIQKQKKLTKTKVSGKKQVKFCFRLFGGCF